MTDEIRTHTRTQIDGHEIELVDGVTQEELDARIAKRESDVRATRIQTLTEGRIVHYVVGLHQCRAAIVTKVWRIDDQPPENGCCNLQIFPDGDNDRWIANSWATSRTYSHEHIPGTWHWPNEH